jgi:DNA-binding response OmpR family regulator
MPDEASAKNGAGAKDVIIADNDSIVRGILRSMLESQGYTVLLAVDGLEALDLAMRTSATLVILDYKMPRLDGFATCMQIRRLPGYADVPIAILTAFDNTDTRDLARRAGVTLFVTKPFKPADLLHDIRTLVGADGGRATDAPVLVWERRQEPVPLFGEPAQLSEGRRVLNICRR